MDSVYNKRRYAIKIPISKIECIRIHRYIYERLPFLKTNEVTESLVQEKLLCVLKKLETKMYSTTQTRSISIYPTEAQAVFYLYRKYSSVEDPIIQTEFLTFYTSLDRKL